DLTAAIAARVVDSSGERKASASASITAGSLLEASKCNAAARTSTLGCELNTTNSGMSAVVRRLAAATAAVRCSELASARLSVSGEKLGSPPWSSAPTKVVAELSELTSAAG